MTDKLDTKALPSMAPYFGAAAYAALVVGIGMFASYGGGTYGIGFFAGCIAFFVALFFASVLAPCFWSARHVMSEFQYFCFHLVVGIGLGTMYAGRNPYALEWHQFVYNHDAFLISCASMAAWLFIALIVPPGKKRKYRDGWVAAFSPVILFLAAMLLSVPIYVAPVPTDPSCHNVFLGGRTSASPAIRLTIFVGPSGHRKLPELYERFAADYGLSIRGHAYRSDSPQRSICNDDVKIDAGGVFGPEGKHDVAFFPHLGGEGWEPLASELICRLDAEWGDTLTFTGNGGEINALTEIIAAPCLNPSGE